MPEMPSSSAVTVHVAEGTVTIALRGVLDPHVVSQARERIVFAVGSGPPRLVLNVVNVSERCSAECLALIAVTQHLLPVGGTLDICTSNPEVQDILALAGWDGPDPAERPCQEFSPGGSHCPVLGVPREAVRCAGPIRSGGAG